MCRVRKFRLSYNLMVIWTLVGGQHGGEDQGAVGRLCRAARLYLLINPRKS